MTVIDIGSGDNGRDGLITLIVSIVEMLERDDRLRELDEKIADAGEEQKFLLEKQHEQRATELQRAHRRPS